MTRHNFWKFSLAIAVVTILGTASHAGMFTTGNLVISRIGTGSESLSTSAQAVFLDEFATSGTPAGNSVALPTSVSGTNNRLVLNASATSVGQLALSQNKQFLTLAGYNTDVATSVSTSGILRTVGVVSGAGSVNTSTAFLAAGTTPRSAVTSDGTNIWIGFDTGSGTTGGVRHMTIGSATNGTLLFSTPTTNIRVVNIVNGQLYASSSTTQARGVMSIANIAGNLPTAATTAALQVATGSTVPVSSPYDFYFANPNTLYIADDNDVTSGGGLQKWTFDGMNWNKQWNVGSIDGKGLRSLTGTVDALGNPVLYAISAETSSTATGIVTVSVPNRLVTMTDLGGFPPLSLTTLATAGTNQIWRGVDFSPVPEPGSLMLLIAAAIGILSTRRRR